MAEPYLTELKTILARLSEPDNIASKHFFSGAAAYVEGRIFMSLSPAGLALKLPEQDRQALIDLGGTPLQYFAKAPVKKDYIVLPPDIVDDDSVLSDWIGRSIEFVRA